MEGLNQVAWKDYIELTESINYLNNKHKAKSVFTDTLAHIYRSELELELT